MGPTAVFDRSPGVLHRVLEGEAVLVDLATGTYFGLNEVGTWIWERIDGRRSVADLRDAVVGEFAVGPERAERDLKDLLERLRSRKLVVPVPR